MFKSLLKLFGTPPQTPPGTVPPTGHFDIVQTRCVGWVAIPDAVAGEACRLVFRRGTDILYDFETEPADETRHARFEAELGERVTVEDLVDGSVHLLAFDRQGKEGRLTLDRATQIELAQHPIGMPTDMILDVDFSAGGNADPLLGAGWSAGEPAWRWNSGEFSELTFEHPVDSRDCDVMLLSCAFLFPPAVTAQRAEYYIGDDLVHTSSKDIATGELTRFTVPGRIFATPGPKTLLLCHPDAVRPSDIAGIPDERELGYAYKRLVIARRSPVA